MAENIFIPFWLVYVILLALDFSALLIAFRVRKRLTAKEVLKMKDHSNKSEEIQATKKKWLQYQSKYYTFLRRYILAAIYSIVLLVIFSGGYLGTFSITKKPIPLFPLVSLVLFLPLLALTIPCIFLAARTSSKLILPQQDETKSNVK